jgi:hypothetical protein
MERKKDMILIVTDFSPSVIPDMKLKDLIRFKFDYGRSPVNLTVKNEV